MTQEQLPPDPFVDECKRIILEVAEQAVKDYISFSRLSEEEQEFNYDLRTAEQFIFEEAYQIDWGDEVRSPRDLLQMANVEIDWLRRSVNERMDSALHQETST